MENVELQNVSDSSIPTQYHIHLDVFEGPLDLLLHLIKENQIDIYDIPVSQITDQYLRHIDMMESLNLDLAGEFLLMAATLAHIKSQMLLPVQEAQDDPEEEGRDPRAELVRRLLEYQKYKDAAERLFGRPLLDRDVFKRPHSSAFTPKPQQSGEIVDVSIFKLIEAFGRVVQNFHLDETHQIMGEDITLPQRTAFIAETIRSSSEGTVAFQDLFARDSSSRMLVVTFLALLDLLKRGAIRVFQSEAFSDIHLIGTPLLYKGWEYDGERDSYTAGQA